MAKIAWLRENAKVALHNIAIFWWDYKVKPAKTYALCVTNIQPLKSTIN